LFRFSLRAHFAKRQLAAVALVEVERRSEAYLELWNLVILVSFGIFIKRVMTHKTKILNPLSMAIAMLWLFFPVYGVKDNNPSVLHFTTPF
jgi:hypothetical protein